MRNVQRYFPATNGHCHQRISCLLLHSWKVFGENSWKLFHSLVFHEVSKLLIYQLNVFHRVSKYLFTFRKETMKCTCDLTKAVIVRHEHQRCSQNKSCAVKSWSQHRHHRKWSPGYLTWDQQHGWESTHSKAPIRSSSGSSVAGPSSDSPYVTRVNRKRRYYSTLVSIVLTATVNSDWCESNLP